MLADRMKNRKHEKKQTGKRNIQSFNFQQQIFDRITGQVLWKVFLKTENKENNKI